MLAHTDFLRRVAAFLALCLFAAGVAAPVHGQTVEGDEGAGRPRGGALGPRSAAVPPTAESEPLAPGDVTAGIAMDEGEPQFGVAAGAGVLTGRPTVRPPVIDEPPDIDGQLDDEAWADAAHIAEFVQLSPLDGAPGTEATEVYVAYDSA